MLQDKNIQIIKYSNIQYSPKNYNRIKNCKRPREYKSFV